MSEQQDVIRLAIAEYLANPGRIGLTTDLAALAKRFHALPTYADMGGALLVRCDGTVLVVHSNQAWDETSDLEFEEETDPFWVDIAYKTGAEKHPRAENVLLQLATSNATQHDKG